jgi:hypothetical protein
MGQTKQPAIADKPLPEVSAELIEACKQKDPKFGERNSFVGRAVHTSM